MLKQLAYYLSTNRPAQRNVYAAFPHPEVLFEGLEGVIEAVQNDLALPDQAILNPSSNLHPFLVENEKFNADHLHLKVVARGRTFFPKSSTQVGFIFPNDLPGDVIKEYINEAVEPAQHIINLHQRTDPIETG